MMNLPPKPKDALWTDEQWQAIMVRNENTLVSAAAGSGKTAVLVERIIQQLIDQNDPVDVDRLLVVTFTNAAAAEMRQRIGEALENALSSQPGNLHLRRQLSLLNRASISTLHAFCIEVLRTYYYKLGLDPGFRILDKTEAILMRDEIIDELFEEHYSDPENEAFFKLVDTYSGDRSDVELQYLIERLYDFSRSHPWPNVWLNEIVNQYDIAEETSYADIEWVHDLFTELKKELYETATLLDKAEQLLLRPGSPTPYAKTIKSDKNQLDMLIAAGDDWNTLYEVFQTISFPSIGRVTKKDDVDETLKNLVKDLRDAAKENVQSLKKNFFSRPLQDYMQDMVKLAPLMKTLIELVQSFGERFTLAKREKSAFDFSDLEHYCLQILLAEDATADNIIPSEAAHYYKDKFLEVLVDEYQDTNLVQETIIQLVASKDNLFMVGDVKQSIYRFRLAEPTLFLKKYKNFSEVGNEQGLRIDLAQNFRSREEVLFATNFIFRQIMDESIGELDYDEAAELKHGFPYPESTSSQAELLLIDRTEEEERDIPDDVIEAAKEELEARLIAEKIKQLIGRDGEEPSLVYDKNLKRMRPITYRDIVILMRSTSNTGGMVMEELKKHAIPAYIEMSKGYFEATEITTMMSLLHIIDNPDQDIPLASVLRSPIVGLTEEELATIRITNRNVSYFEALQGYLAENEHNELAKKLQRFYKKLTIWRTEARQGALSELIWQLYRDTNYYEFVGGLPGGVQRQANLRALYDRARQYEKTSFRGLFRFLRFIERMQERGQDLGTARALGEQEDVVRLMTIHSSKGLEFPVVFLAGLAKEFNLKDLNKQVLLHKNYGIGTKFVDVEQRISYPTLLQLGIRHQMEKESLAEEMRVLYVGMTRAREKLYLIGTVKEAEKQIQKWQVHLDHTEWLLTDYVRRKGRTYLDWIGPALIRHQDGQLLRDYLEEKDVRFLDVYSDPSTWRVEVIHANELTLEETEKEYADSEKLERLRAGKPIHVESGEKERVAAQLSWTYERQRLTELKAKQTVTELKRQREVIDEQSEQSYASFQNLAEERPRFLQRTKMTAAERGTALHTFMQHLPFEDVSLDSLENKLAQLVNDEILTEEQAAAIDLSLIHAFTKTPLFTRLKEAEKTFREIPFTFAVPALENSEEKVIVQGVIDLVLEEEDGLVLIDYKTDAITERYSSFEAAKPILLNRYRVQLDLYEQAIEHIWKKRVKEKYLYFFDGSHLLTLS